jgi:molecular chaperone DnaK (HSP70)
MRFRFLAAPVRHMVIRRLNFTVRGDMRLALLLLTLGASAVACAGEGSIPVEGSNPTVAANAVLLEAVGIGTTGGTFAAILPKGCKLPCSASNTFGTAKDGQRDITLHLFRGNSRLLTEAHALGSYQISGFTPGPRGTTIVVVTLRVDTSGIHLSANDNHADTTLAILRVAP